MSAGAFHSQLLDPRALAQLAGLQARARKVVDGLLQGIHKSPHHGSSIEFSEHKEYSPGDEIRHIDWKAFGRLDKYYVKRFEQESNLTAWFVVDRSASMAYGRAQEGGGALTKFEYASVLAVSLAHLLLQQQDAVGLVTFGDDDPALLPPRGRTSHLPHMCKVLEETKVRGGTSIETGLTAILERARKRGFVYVLSDFFGETEAAFKAMRQLVGRGHQVTAFQVLDGDELSFPFGEMTLFEGMESKQRLLVEPRLVRDAYMKRLKAHLQQVRAQCLRAQVAYALADTREAPGRLLLKYLTGHDVSSPGASLDPDGARDGAREAR